MGVEYASYLASSVLNDDGIVTFRVLSRELGVNSHVAKQMLFDFREKENAKKANSVHATYLLVGTKRQSPNVSGENGSASKQDGEDAVMQSGPSDETSGQPTRDEVDNDPVQTITLVGEENLDDLKSTYDQISSIHIYSIQATRLKNLDLVTSVYEDLHSKIQSEDAIEFSKTHGPIHNPRAKRRTAFRSPPSSAPKAEGSPLTSAAAKSLLNRSSNAKSGEPTAKGAVDKGDSTEVKKQAPATQTTGGRQPTIKRESSDLFKSFAKAKMPSKKTEASTGKGIKPETTDSSASGTHSMPVGNLSSQAEISDREDVKMEEDDEGDGDSSFVTSKARGTQRSQADRDVELHKKIFDDDEEGRAEGESDADTMDATPTGAARDEETDDATSKTRQQQSDGNDDDDDENMSEDQHENTRVEEAAVEEVEPAPAPVTAGGGRRRGRRRIMRKRMIKDADGYLVTREEPGWESFSEDEESSESAAAAHAGSAPSSFSRKAAGAKAGMTSSQGSGSGSSQPQSQPQSQSQKRAQGNIMSFFGKGSAGASKKK